MKKGEERSEGPLTYDGEWNTKSIVEFLEENAVSLQEEDSDDKAKDEL